MSRTIDDQSVAVRQPIRIPWPVELITVRDPVDDPITPTEFSLAGTAILHDPIVFGVWHEHRRLSVAGLEICRIVLFVDGPVFVVVAQTIDDSSAVEIDEDDLIEIPWLSHFVRCSGD
jgi:hypothetical protein